MMTTARFGLEGSAACREEGTAHPAPLYLRVNREEYYSDRLSRLFFIVRLKSIECISL
jgi:hypothetical protein